MWARATTVLTAGALAVALAGCSAATQWAGAIAADERATTPETVTAYEQMAAAQDASELAAARERVLAGDYADAAARLVTLIPRLEARPDRRHAAAAVFWLGYCREKQRRPDEAAALYRRLTGEYADEPAARQAARRLGLLLPSSGDRP